MALDEAYRLIDPARRGNVPGVSGDLIRQGVSKLKSTIPTPAPRWSGLTRISEASKLPTPPPPLQPMKKLGARGSGLLDTATAMTTRALRNNSPGLFQRFGANLVPKDSATRLGYIADDVFRRADEAPIRGKMYKNLTDAGYKVQSGLKGGLANELRQLGLVGNRAPQSMLKTIGKDVMEEIKGVKKARGVLSKVAKTAALPFALERAMNPMRFAKLGIDRAKDQAEDLKKIKAARKAGLSGAAAETALDLKTLKVMPAGVDNLGGLVKRASAVDEGLGAASKVVKKLGLADPSILKRGAKATTKGAMTALPIIGGIDDLTRAGQQAIDFAEDPSLKKAFTTAVSLGDGLISTFGGGLFDTLVLGDSMKDTLIEGKDVEETPQGVVSWATDKLKIDDLFGVTDREKYGKGGLFDKLF